MDRMWDWERVKCLVGCLLIYVISEIHYLEIRAFLGSLNGGSGQHGIGLLALGLICLLAAGLLASWEWDPVKFALACLLVYALSVKQYPEIRTFFWSIRYLGNGTPEQQWIGLLAFTLVSVPAAGMIRWFVALRNANG